MGRKNWEVSHVPTLNRHLLEGAFAQCMSQVLMSLDQCRLHKDTPRMSLEDHVRALWVIAKDELGTALMLVEDRHAATMPRKQALWRRRSQTCLSLLKAADPDTDAGLNAILNGVVHWIQDAHLILHEDTDDKTREYLANKFLTKEEISGHEEAKSVIDIQ
jgi:hypothetical protein